MSVTETVRTLVEPALADAGLSLYDVEFSGGRLAVLVDKDGGVDLDALTEATHIVSALVDESDPVPGGSYVLEVSSPGVERPLRTAQHFRAAVGSRVAVKTIAGADHERRVEAVLAAADDTGIEIDGRRLAYGEIERARTVFEWGPAPKPGKAPRPRAPKAQAPHQKKATG